MRLKFYLILPFLLLYSFVSGQTITFSDDFVNPGVELTKGAGNSFSGGGYKLFWCSNVDLGNTGGGLHTGGTWILSDDNATINCNNAGQAYYYNDNTNSLLPPGSLNGNGGWNAMNTANEGVLNLNVGGTTAPTIAIDPPTLPAATLGIPYIQTITATGGTFPYTYAVTTGTLPAGLQLTPNGQLSGRPTAGGSSTFTITATDALSFTGARVYSSFTVNVPKITATAALTSLSATYGTASALVQNFTVSGNFITDGILITSPDGFEVSKDGVTYSSAVTVAAANGSVPGTTIQVRLTATATAGNHSGDIVLSSSNAANVNVPTAATNTVAPAPLTLIAKTASKIYGQTLTQAAGFTDFEQTGLVNGQTVGSVTIAYGTGGPATAAAGNYPGSISLSTATAGTFNPANYSITYTPADLTVSPAPLTITAAGPEKSFGSTLITGSSTDNFIPSTPQNGETVTNVVLTPDAAGLSPSSPVGSNYTVTPSAATGTNGFMESNYQVDYVSYHGVVGIAGQTITFNPLTAATYGDAPITLNGTSSASLTVEYASSDPNVAAVSGNIITIKRTGTTTITASQPGNSNYSAAAPITQNLIIKPKPLTVTANNKRKTYGQLLADESGSAAFTQTGLVGSETIGSVTITYGPGAAAAAAANTYAGSVTANTATGGTFIAANYTITYTNGDLVVDPASVTITAANKEKTYGQEITGSAGATDFTAAGLQNSETIGSVTIAYGTGAAAAAAAGTYTGSVAVSNAAGGNFNVSNYTINYAPGTLTVTPAPLTITADNKSKVSGSPNPALTASYDGFVNGDDNNDLTAQPNLSTTATTNSPVNTYPITVSAASSNNYTISYVPGTLTVTNAELTITANNQSKVYGSANPALTFTYSGFVNGDGPSGVTTPPSVSTTATANSAAGTYPVTASGAVIPGYNINYVPGTLTVTPAPLTITADNKSKVSGNPNPALTASYDGFVNGDDNNDLTAQPSLSTTATTNSPVNTYPVTASAAASNNYTISYVPGTLTVTSAELTITANHQSKIYGSANPALTFTYSGFVNGDGPSSLTTPPSVSTTATANSAAGTYPITVSGAVIPGYSIVYIPGTLTVTPAPLIITADNKSKVSGSPNPALTASYDGFVNGDDNNDLTAQPSLSTTATTNSPVNTYPITASAAASNNYTISYMPGTLTVTSAELTITANHQSKVYGSANPALTFTYSGFVNGDGPSSLTTPPLVSTAATANSAAGTYPVTPSGAVIPGYSIVYVPGTLTVTPAALTITADNKSRNYGADNPELTVAYSGFVNGDQADKLATLPVAATTAGSTTDPGNYPITVSGAASPNYSFNYINATLTIIPLTSTDVSDLTISSGTLSPAFESGTHSYKATVDNKVDNIRVTTAADPTAAVMINGSQITNGSSSVNIPLNVGDNLITVIVTAQDGVTKNTYTIAVYRGPSSDTVTATNILTPNGDGKNDTWVIRDIELYPENSVKVFDRGGRQVFAQHGYHNDWGGTLKGVPLTEGTYYYAVDLGPGLHKFNGFITILRSK